MKNMKCLIWLKIDIDCLVSKKENSSKKNRDNRWSRSLAEVVRQTRWLTFDLKLSPHSEKIAIKKVGILSYQKKLFGRSPRQQMKCS